MHLWVSPVLTYSLKCITMIHLRFLIIDKNECNIPVLTLKHFVSCYITLIWRVFYCIYTLHHIYLVSHWLHKFWSKFNFSITCSALPANSSSLDYMTHLGEIWLFFFTIWWFVNLKILGRGVNHTGCIGFIVLDHHVCFKFLFSMNPFSQILHLHGLSPLWDNWPYSKHSLIIIILPHCRIFIILR